MSRAPEDGPRLRIMPLPGHPSSLWTNFAVDTKGEVRPYILPGDLGFPDELGERLFRWTDYHRELFVNDTYALGEVPRWRNGADLDEWNREGLDIAATISLLRPDWLVVYTGASALVAASLEGPTPTVASRDGVRLPPTRERLF